MPCVFPVLFIKALALVQSSAVERRHMRVQGLVYTLGILVSFWVVVAVLLGWLLAGRPDGPVFLTGRRAPAGSAPAHTCPVTGRARMSYRRAAEIFTSATVPLDPAGRGWTLHQLCLAGQDRIAAITHRG